MKQTIKFVVHCKKEPYDIYIGRPSFWGNPFSHKSGTSAKYKVKTREEAIEKFREYVLSNPEMMQIIDQLKGKILGCWCSPQPCHGDVLADIANKL